MPNNIYETDTGAAVRIRRKNLKREHYFSVKVFGSKQKALAAARAYLATQRRYNPKLSDPTWRTGVVAPGSIYLNGRAYVAYLRHRGKNYTKRRTANDANAQAVLARWLLAKRQELAREHGDTLEENL